MQWNIQDDCHDAAIFLIFVCIPFQSRTYTVVGYGLKERTGTGRIDESTVMDLDFVGC
ncbi:hypothetical protein BJX66DRAFT_297369 [Aspergillus keveii]|uniref:Uncharacterized protein n=1 Tax=Aspergillus keveii TaxID=714993 RepID=A0ABR4GG77_9EURO